MTSEHTPFSLSRNDLQVAAAAASPSLGGDEVDPELAAFAAEITAIDPEALQGTAPARASTPPPNEQRFTDDDGTVSPPPTHSLAC